MPEPSFEKGALACEATFKADWVVLLDGERLLVPHFAADGDGGGGLVGRGGDHRQSSGRSPRLVRGLDESTAISLTVIYCICGFQTRDGNQVGLSRRVWERWWRMHVRLSWKRLQARFGGKARAAEQIKLPLFILFRAITLTRAFGLNAANQSNHDCGSSVST